MRTSGEVLVLLLALSGCAQPESAPPPSSRGQTEVPFQTLAEAEAYGARYEGGPTTCRCVPDDLFECTTQAPDGPHTWAVTRAEDAGCG